MINKLTNEITQLKEHASSVETILAAVLKMSGMAVVPQSVMDNAKYTNVKFKYIDEDQNTVIYYDED